MENFFHWIASDKEIVKSVLLLTGSIEGTKAQVMEYIDTFKKFDFLYITDLQSSTRRSWPPNPAWRRSRTSSRSTWPSRSTFRALRPCTISAR